MIKLTDISPIILHQIADSIKSYNQFSGHNTLPELLQDDAGIPVYNLDDIEKGLLYKDQNHFVICHIIESIHLLLIWKKNGMSMFPPNKKYLFLTNGQWNSGDFDIPLDYDVVHWPMFNLIFHASYNNHPATKEFWYDRTYDFDGIKDGTFIGLFGSEKPFRDRLVKKIMEMENDLGNFTLRYKGNDYKMLDNLTDILPKVIPENGYVRGTAFNGLGLQMISPSDLYKRFRFNLVVESNAYSVDEFHPTEKICKPLVVGMPFVVYGSYRFLHNLRELGFQTYRNLWSEEYDEIQDCDKRIESLLQTCKDLVRFDWQKNRSELIEIAWNNSNALRNLQKMVKRDLENFIQKVQQGMMTNGH